MGAIVRPSIPTVDIAEISSGVGVRGRTWMDASSLANYLTGRGRVLVPVSCGGIQIPASTKYTFRFRSRTSSAAEARRWQLHFAAASTSNGSRLRIEAPDGVGGLLEVPVGIRTSVSSQFAEYLDFTGGVGSETQLTIGIDNTGSVPVDIIGISCVECPRARLNLDASDLGIDENASASREPLIELDNAGLVGVVDVLSDYGNGGRGGLFHFATDTTAALTNSDHTTDTLLMPLTIPILGRREYEADIRSTASARVYCKTDVTGTTGRVRITNSHGTATITIPAASHAGYAWFPSTAGAPEQFYIDCEDAASLDGRQTAGTPVWDDLTIDYRRTSATGTLSVAGVSIWEE